MAFLTKPQINEMAQAILSTHEVTPLSHSSKCRVALEYALDEFGVKPNKPAVLLAVKLANLGWEATKIHTCRELSR